jgi:hypothetical protein
MLLMVLDFSSIRTVSVLLHLVWVFEVPDMRVGIYNTYSRSEETAAAIHLANTLQKLGAEISWLAPLGAVTGVHPEWDHVIRTVDLVPSSRWIQGLDAIIWFHPRVEAAALARSSGTKGLKQFRVMSRLSLSAPSEFVRFDRIVIPHTHPQVIEEMREFLQRYDLATRLIVCPWSTGINDVVKARAKANDQAQTILAYCDGRTWRRDGHFVIEIARELVMAPEMKRWKLCLAFDDAADGGAEPMLERARKCGNGRLTISSRPSLIQLRELIRNADRFVLPDASPDWSVFRRWAEAYGIPVLTGDLLSPANTGSLKLAVAGQLGSSPRYAGAGETLYDLNMLRDAILKSCAIHTPRAPAPPEDAAAFINFWRALLKDG